jgi:hypothetical protein
MILLGRFFSIPFVQEYRICETYGHANQKRSSKIDDHELTLIKQNIILHHSTEQSFLNPVFD